VLEPAPLKKWMLPFPKTGTGTQSVAAQEDDPQEFTKSWGQSACDGFYPLGLNGQWHGGIHFDADTGSRFNQADGVRCIADGEVIAYRYDVIPPKSCYKNYEQVQADFATSFALVRHRLQVSETFMQGDNAGKTTPSCVFYSLYMHLRHWDVYENDQGIPRPGFWVRDLSQCKVGERVSDPAPQNKDNAPNWEGWGHDPQTCKMPEPKLGPDGQPLPLAPNAPTCEIIPENPAPPAGGKGINLRDHPSGTLVGWAPRDTVIKLGALVQVGNDKENWYRITGIEGDVFWRNDFNKDKLIKQCRVHVGKLDFPIKGPQDKGKDGVYVFPAVPNDKKVAGNLQETAAIKAGELVGHLGNYLRFNPEVIDCATRNSRTVTHLEVFSPTFKKFIEDCRELEPTAPLSEKNLLKIDKGAKPVFLPGYDEKLVNGELLMPAKDSPKEGLFIKLARNKLERGKTDVQLRGDFAPNEAGYKKAEQYYLKANDAATKYYFFAAVDENGEQSVSANTFSTGRTHRKVFVPEEGKAVWVLRSWYEGRPERLGNINRIIEINNAFTQAWKEFPLKAGQNEVKGSVVAVQVIDVKKKGNPLIVHSDEGTTPHSAKDDQGDKAATWWQIKYAAIEEGMFRDTVFQGEGWISDKDFPKVTKCSPWSWPAFETTEEDPLNPLDWFKRRLVKDYTPSTPLLSQLFKLLDEDGNKELTDKEIQAGWGKPWLAQTLSRQVIKHKSEWGLPMSEWDALDKEMSEYAGKIPFSNIRPEKVWEEEKKRIEKLLWWDKVAGNHGFPAKDQITVWHVHPLGLIENFYESEQTQLITLEMLNVACPEGSPQYHQSILNHMNKYAPLYDINTPIRIAHFLAQVAHESKFKTREEDGNYNPRRMRQIFGCRLKTDKTSGYNPNTDDCDTSRLRPKLWTEEGNYAHNARNLLSYVYADRMENGSEPSQEGYKYRGRGIIQLTGKKNYRITTQFFNEKNPDDIQDFVENPHLISESLKYGIASAFIYVTKIGTGFLVAADSDNVTNTTIAVNGALTGLGDRTERLNNLKNLMGI